MRTLKRTWFKWPLLLFLTACGAYAFSVRFLGFIGASRSEKVILLAASLLGFSILFLIIAVIFQKRFKGTVSKGILPRLIIISALTAAYISIILGNPPFPEKHTLEITIPEPSDTITGTKRVHIITIDRIYQPGRERVPIDVSELTLSGNWHTLADNSLVWEGGTVGFIKYQAVMQAVVEIVFNTIENPGQVIVHWDDIETTLDLAQLDPPSHSELLFPSYDLSRADRIRRLLVYAALAAEFIVLTALLSLSTLLMHILIYKRITLRFPRILAYGSAVFIFLILATYFYFQPVRFEDSTLENLVRQVIHNTESPITRQQLRTITILDAREKRISSLEGVQYLTNLAELDLRDNLITDISPLNQLKHLQKINLRGNMVTDLSPLTDHASLVYLNLHSNTGIRTIAPLEDLVNLDTLILRNVPVNEEIAYLQNLTNLRKLNLRNTGVADLSIIGNLIASGALQDDKREGLEASLNIADNPISFIKQDGYAVLHPYWENINSRVPLVLPRYATLPAPQFSHPAGFYPAGFMLEISGVEQGLHIHYTLDGSEPTLNSPRYTSPIPVQHRQSDTAYLKDIYNHSVAPEEISMSPIYTDWQGPNGSFIGASVVRARIFDQEYQHSSIPVTSTYWIDESFPKNNPLPVVSLSTNPDYLFDETIGIYALGDIYEKYYIPNLSNSWFQPANYTQHGTAWERPVHIEFFEQNGELGLAQDGAVRLHGGATRGAPYKSLRLYARKEYGESDKFLYRLFPGLINHYDAQPVTEFDNFLLRNSGNDFESSLFRDALMHSLVKHTSLDIQDYQPVIVFINGSYWGILNLRQNLDEYYFSSMYGINPEGIVILDEDHKLYRGSPGDEDRFYALHDFLEENNPIDEEKYDYVQTQMDTDNFIDYQAAEIYFANTDWASGNTQVWRSKEPVNQTTINPGQDGRWRWTLFDTDYGFGLYPDESTYSHNTLKGSIKSGSMHRNIFSSLLSNDEFKRAFINRLADHLNTSFREEHVLETINQMQAALYPEIGDHIRRWRTMGDSIEGWVKNVEVLREFARQRPANLRQHVLEQFGLSGTAELSLQSDSSKGYIQVNSIDITGDTPGVDDPSNWTGVYFKGVPIQIKAVPYPGYQFAGWQEMENPATEAALTITLSEDFSLSANFTPLQ